MKYLMCWFGWKTRRTAVRPPVGAGGRSHVTSRCATGVGLLCGESPLARRRPCEASDRDPQLRLLSSLEKRIGAY